jgi:hypothetical protein
MRTSDSQQYNYSVNDHTSTYTSIWMKKKMKMRGWKWLAGILERQQQQQQQAD